MALSINGNSNLDKISNIQSGETHLCLKWKDFVITGFKKEIKVFDLNESLLSPIQTFSLANGDIFNSGAYLIVNESTLYIGGERCIYVM